MNIAMSLVTNFISITGLFVIIQDHTGDLRVSLVNQRAEIQVMPIMIAL